jgi:hypothetical protein
MTDYYFLANSLPSIEVGNEPDLSFVDLCHLFDLNLTASDKTKVESIRRYYDLLNLRLLWLDVPLDRRGSYSAIDLNEALLMREGFGDYLFTYLDRFDGNDALIRHFGELVVAFFQHKIASHSGFLHEYFAFERELRLVILGFRSKQLHRDVAKELQHEDPSDVIVAQIMAQKDTKNYEPPFGYEELKPLFEEFHEDPIALHKALCHYRFKKIQQMVEGDLFSMDFILSYLVRLIIVEQWMELDEGAGEKIVKSIVKEIS